MKKLFVIAICLFMHIITYAQTHTYDACCRYGKGNVMGDCICPACKKDKDDNNKALEAEAKQVQEKAAAENAQKEAAIKKANEEAANKQEAGSNTVYIEMPKVKKEPIKSVESVIKVSNVSDKTIMVPFTTSQGLSLFGVEKEGFMDTANNLLFFVDRTLGYLSMRNFSFQNSYPKNLGMIYLDKSNGEGGGGVDILHPNGTREFNDYSIRYFIHLKDDYFILQANEDKDIFYLYNVKTKEKLKLPSPSRYLGYPIYIEKAFVPIFDELSYSKLNKDYYLNKDKIASSVELKSNFIKIFPDKINETILTNNSFCLIISHGCQVFKNYENTPTEIKDFKIVYVSKTGQITIK